MCRLKNQRFSKPLDTGGFLEEHKQVYALCFAFGELRVPHTDF